MARSGGARTYSFEMPEGHFRLLAIPRRCLKPCNASVEGVDVTCSRRHQSNNLFTNLSKKSVEKSNRKGLIGFLEKCSGSSYRSSAGQSAVLVFGSTAPFYNLETNGELLSAPGSGEPINKARTWCGSLR